MTKIKENIFLLSYASYYNVNCGVIVTQIRSLNKKICFQVISARKGEFETGFDRGGQTREHAMLAKTAGVKHLVALVNKMDDPTVNWDEKR